MDRPELVAVIDDDEMFRQSLARLVKSEGYNVAEFASAEAFLRDSAQVPIDCAIVDVQMPGLGGLHLQRQINESRWPLAVIFLSGCAGIPDSVQAMKAGAIDFLQKPVAGEELFAAIRSAMERVRTARTHSETLAELRQKHALLTPREGEVFGLVTAGLLNKQIAFKLGTTERTIKAHRRRVMDKLEAESLAQLVRIADQIGVAHISKAQRDEISGRWPNSSK